MLTRLIDPEYTIERYNPDYNDTDDIYCHDCGCLDSCCNMGDIPELYDVSKTNDIGYVYCVECVTGIFVKARDRDT